MDSIRVPHITIGRTSLVNSRRVGGEHRLITRLARGDDQALEEMYVRFGDALFRYLRTLVADRRLAEEVLQDTFVAAWRGARDYRGESSVKTWLFAIARRRARDTMRHRYPNSVDGDHHLVALVDPEPGPEELLEASVQWQESATVLGELAPLHREALALVFFHGFSYAAAAKVLDVPVGTVKSRLNAARKTLRQKMENQEQRER